MGSRSDSTKKFQQISPAYKCLTTEDADEDRFEFLKKMIRNKRRDVTVQLSSEDGGIIVLFPYSRWRYSSSRNENSDPPMNNLTSEKANQNAEELIREENVAKKKTEKKRIRKLRQRENRRKAKEGLRRQMDEFEEDLPTAGNSQEYQHEKNKEVEDKNDFKSRMKTEHDHTQNDEYLTTIVQPLQQSDLAKGVEFMKQTRNDAGRNIHPSGPESAVGGEEEEEGDIDISCAFFSKTIEQVQRKSISAVRVKNGLKMRNDPLPGNAEKNCDSKQNNFADTKTNERKSSISPNYQRMVMEGNKKANEAKFTEAIALFTQALSINSSDHRIFSNRSFCFEKLSKFERALHDAEKAIFLAPDWWKGYFRKGQALLGLKKYVSAEASFEHILKFIKNSADAERELFHTRVKRLQEMGFSKQKSVIAIRNFKTVDDALGHILADNSSDQEVNDDVYISDDEDDIEVETQVLNTEKKFNGNERESKSSVWIGNVTMEISESVLYRYFIQFGPIFNVKISRIKSYAFVNFIQPESATRALQNGQHIYMLGSTLVLRNPCRRPIPGRMQEQLGTTQINNFTRNPVTTGNINNAKECHFWRNKGCCNGPECRFLHVPDHQGIDSNRE